MRVCTARKLHTGNKRSAAENNNGKNSDGSIRSLVRLHARAVNIGAPVGTEKIKVRERDPLFARAVSANFKALRPRLEIHRGEFLSSLFLLCSSQKPPPLTSTYIRVTSIRIMDTPDARFSDAFRIGKRSALEMRCAFVLERDGRGKGRSMESPAICGMHRD